MGTIELTWGRGYSKAIVPIDDINVNSCRIGTSMVILLKALEVESGLRQESAIILQIRGIHIGYREPEPKYLLTFHL